jgi:hypothetical protein
MTLLILLALLLALDLVAWRWGHDSRDGRDWKSRQQRRHCRHERLMLGSLGRFAVRRRRWALAGTLLANQPPLQQPSACWTRGSAPSLRSHDRNQP